MMERLKDWLNELNLDFVRWRYVAGAMSAFLVVASWVLFATVGPNWGIDFTGGTEIQMRFDEPVEISELRGTLQTLGLSEDAVQRVGDPDDYTFQVRIADSTFGAAEAEQEVTQELTEKFGPDFIEATRFDAEVGARMTVVYQGERVRLDDVQDALSEISGAAVQPGAEDNQFVVQLPGLHRQIKERISNAMGRDFTVEAVESVGPKVGADLRRQAFIAISATLFLVLIYVAFRFDVAFAPGAILALFHDVTITVGIFVLTQREFSLPLIGALLTIIGYSLNDTIVIYDRIRENKEKFPRKPMTETINISVNETFSRTVLTGVTTILAISPFLLFGGAVVEDFAFAMLLGIIFGIYSTVYVASPMIIVMEDLKPYLQRMIVGGGKSDGGTPGGGGGEEAADERPLTESEKRRRERAQRERAGVTTTEPTR